MYSKGALNIFFNLITGELKPDDGQIQLFGTDITKKTVQARARLGLGRTYQISQLFLADDPLRGGKSIKSVFIQNSTQSTPYEPSDQHSSFCA